MSIWKGITRILGLSGNVADVNEDGQLHVVQEGKISDGNSSNVPLLADGVFTGVSVETLPFAVIVVSVYSDVMSAIDGLAIEQSIDNVNWDHCDNFTIQALSGKTFSFQPQAKYVRVVYTNGGTDQTIFRLQTTLKKTYVKPSSHRIQDNIVNDDDAELIKAVITGEDKNGVFRNVKTTEDGNLTISDNSDGLAIAEGNVTGKSFVHKFGTAPDFDTSDGEIVVWDGADDAHIDQMDYVFSIIADIDSLSSDNVADTQDIEIIGLDTNYAQVMQIITLNGQNRVALTTPLIRVFRMKNVNTTDIQGHIYCYVNTAIAGGIPIDTTKIRAVIQPKEVLGLYANNQTEMAVYTIPLGKKGYIRKWYSSSAGSNKTTNIRIKLYARPFGEVFQLKHNMSWDGSIPYDYNYNEPEGPFTEKTDILMTAQLLAVGVTGGAVSAGFDIVLVDN